MQFLGAPFKRKSLASLDPQLPKIKSRQQRFSGKRTIHKELANPSDELKDFKRRLIFTQTTEKELSKLVADQRMSTLENSRIKHPDEYSTHVHTQKLSFPETSLLHRYQSETQLKLEDEEIIKVDPFKQEEEKEKQNESNEDEKEKENEDDFDGYLEGNKVDEEEEEEKNKLNPKLKSYSHRDKINHNLKPQYEFSSPAENRMSTQYWSKQFLNLRNRKSDQQFMKIIDEYKFRRQHMIEQSIKKYQIKKVIGNAKASIARTTSQTKLARNFVNVPSYEQILNPDDDKSKKTAIQKRVEGSLSAARIHKKSKSDKQDLLEKDMEATTGIGIYLREKGIEVDQESLKRGLLNVREVPEYGEIKLPSLKLLSNPTFKLKPL